ncbi:uncharacterized protein LOC117340938 [Pecten maximus]|uniref:uncharacterized protein LOC117340938 n=1 Tax=Pecten maximus TaxID=6579 RepID=UPI0014585DDB|nr:uncharacterized protein LOC117340938 [Pecten maximus]
MTKSNNKSKQSKSASKQKDSSMAQSLKRQRTDDEQVSEIFESISAINDSSVMSKLASKLLSNELFVQSVQESLDVPSVINSAVQPLTNLIDKLTSRVEDLEQYSRRNCLKVSGISGGGVNTDENTDDLLLKLFNTKMGLNINKHDISRSHRVMRYGQPFNSGKPNDIIVRFNSYRTRELVYRARFSLKDQHSGTHPNHRIFINEALTSQRALLFRDARDLVKKGMALKAITVDGSIVVTDRNNKKHKFTTSSRMNSIFPLPVTEFPSNSSYASAAKTNLVPMSTSTPVVGKLQMDVIRGRDGNPLSASIKPVTPK